MAIKRKAKGEFISAPALRAALVILAAASLLPLVCPQGDVRGQSRTPDVVYVGTPYDVVSMMLKLARVKKGDLVYDLGCGDGRMVVLAAKKYGCRGIGYDIDPERVAAALENVKRNRVGRLVKIVEQDLFTLDFSEADVLSLYLLPEINEKLLPQFEKLKPGSRLVFHDYGLPEFEADKEIRVISNEDNASHTLYLYSTPFKRTKG
ncbi:MAG TPA: methyltransferase domain-containing protein [Acidobacteriota bacterium]|nr:methyltransferase domain-containing protein [Acidobacteriota bacterium]